MIINIIRWIHYAIVLFFLFGFLLPDKYVWTYILFVIILKIHWMTNNDKCILTELEEKFNPIQERMISDTRYPFIGKMMKNFNIILSDEQYDIIFNVLIVIAVFYSIYRYKKYLSNIKYKLVK
jgi:hypothetical protein